MKLSYLAKEGGGTLVGEDREITSLCTDSRVAGEGDLFFCFRGTQRDSHDFAAEVGERGGSALVVERETDAGLPYILVEDARRAMAKIAAAFYGHPEKKMKFVGVTGTNGKTTTSKMLYGILCAAQRKAGLIGTLGAVFAGRTIPPALTTPDPISLFSLLSDMAEAGVEIVVMEVSAHALALKKVEPIFYDIAVFTNLTQDHLDFFKDMASYGAAKKLLFSADKCGCAVLNSDDPFTAGLDCKRVCTYGLESPADCFALVEQESIRSLRVLFNLEDELIETELAMTGRHNVYNALAAAVAARKLGVSPRHIAAGLAETTVDGRLEWVASHRGADIFVDFAHTPDGLEKSLAALRPHCKRRLILVFGCGGDRDRDKRPKMGEIAARLADFSVITSDNPRYEDPAAIIAEIEAGFCAVSNSYVCVEEREEGIFYALSLLEEGDVLLVAGKGGETQQEIMGIKYSYNDKAVIRSFLEK